MNQRDRNDILEAAGEADPPPEYAMEAARDAVLFLSRYIGFDVERMTATAYDALAQYIAARTAAPAELASLRRVLAGLKKTHNWYWQLISEPDQDEDAVSSALGAFEDTLDTAKHMADAAWTETYLDRVKKSNKRRIAMKQQRDALLRALRDVEHPRMLCGIRSCAMCGRARGMPHAIHCSVGAAIAAETAEIEAIEADLGRGPVTHTAKRADGSEVQVTVPEDPDPAEILADALRENFSPHGIALMYSTLQTARCDDPNVEHEIANLWQHDLVNLVGGPDEMNRLCDEIGK